VREITTPVVFSMCQGPEANHALQQIEARGTLIVNSPRAVQGCYRTNLCRVDGAAASIMAPTTLVATARDGAQLDFAGGRSYWVKRGDVHATQQGDVVRVTSRADTLEVLDGFRRRGIGEAALQPHIPGQVVKFYGVVGTPFFRYYTEGDFKLCPVAFNLARPAIDRLARAIGLEVYGGDAVLAESGEIFVIDVNDWPSFAYFRAEAAEVIAARLQRRAVEHLAASAAARPAVSMPLPALRRSR